MVGHVGVSRRRERLIEGGEVVGELLIGAPIHQSPVSADGER